jgi:predicted GTPase
MIEWLALGGYALYKLFSAGSASVGASVPVATLPRRIITFVGRTGVGKSSTANALLRSTAFVTSAAHGTTTSIADRPYRHGFVIRDTPGSMDDVSYLPFVWPALEESAIVVYTTAGQLYRVELEFLQVLHTRQRAWDGGMSHRKLLLYVNQSDTREGTMPKALRDSEEAAIKAQVSTWISPEEVAFGAASPKKNGLEQPSRVDSLEALLAGLIVQYQP